MMDSAACGGHTLGAPLWSCAHLPRWRAPERNRVDVGSHWGTLAPKGGVDEVEGPAGASYVDPSTARLQLPLETQAQLAAALAELLLHVARADAETAPGRAMSEKISDEHARRAP